jgi:hypothetical protein
MRLIDEFREEEKELLEVMEKLTENKQQMEGMVDLESNTRLKVLLADLDERINNTETRLQNLKESRFSAKSDLDGTNSFTDEGIYYCIVTNIRGGSIPVMRKSNRVVVAVEHSVPYTAVVKPYYRPRRQEIRKKWTTYVFCSTVLLPSFLDCDVSASLSFIHLLLPVCLLSHHMARV